MYGIGIVGAGIAALHLALCLQYLNIPATLYTDRSSVAMRVMPLKPLTVRLAQVRRRERALGVEHWSLAEVGLHGGHLDLTGDSPWSVYGALDAPASVIDPRLYGATLLEDFQARGGVVQVQPTLTSADVAHLSDSHSLMVVTDGRPSLVNRLFASLSDQTSSDIPQRIVSLGLFHGLDFPSPAGFAVHIHPIQGEIVHLPCLTFDGLASALLFEGRPGSEIAGLRYLRHGDNSVAFENAVLRMLRHYAPDLYDSVSLADFGLTGPLDLFQGGVAPTVRRGWASLGNGKYALALGEARAQFDPLALQEASVASACAWALGDVLRTATSYEADFCQTVDQRLHGLVQPAAAWANTFLAAPPTLMLAEMVAGWRLQPASPTGSAADGPPLEQTLAA